MNYNRKLGDDTLLTELGASWAKGHAGVGQRDVPSRRLAHDLASAALGRRATAREAMKLQLAARAARNESR